MGVASLVFSSPSGILPIPPMLYTFIPCKVTGAFIGAALIVVGSIMPLFELLRLRSKWKREHSGAVTSIVTYMSLMTLLMWTLASWVSSPRWCGFSSLGLFRFAKGLIPWPSHPLLAYRPPHCVLLAASSLYLLEVFASKQLAANWSQILWLACLCDVLALFNTRRFSSPINRSHVPAAWKMIHLDVTMFVGIPSMLTAFTVAGSLEYGAV
ncbi:MAG: hypothetical protein R2865_15565 [Deinococcales bacterium]